MTWMFLPGPHTRGLHRGSTPGSEAQRPTQAGLMWGRGSLHVGMVVGGTCTLWSLPAPTLWVT